jgi:GPI-anchor transamidase subunit K
MRFLLFLSLLLTCQFLPKTQSAPVAILLSTSKFFFNYRMSANVFSLMNLLRDQGFGNSEMLTLVPEMVTSNPRNNAPGSVSVIDGSITPNIAVDNIIDYRYEDVSVRGFLNILRGRYLRKV